MGRKKTRPTLIKTIPEEEISPNGNVVQMNYLGEQEELPSKLYRFKLLCTSCGSGRYYKSQDRKQVEASGKCKPCLRKIRTERRRNKKAISQTA